MKYLIVLLLGGCALTVQPVDLVPNGSYCEPYHADVYICRDHRTVHKCVNRYGRWDCRRVK